MSQLWTDLDNPSLTDDYVSPTSDVLLGEFQESHRDFVGWPFLMAENVTAFKDADLLELAIPEERSAREPKTIFVTLSFPDKPSRSFIFIAATTSTPPYTLVEDHFGPSLRKTRFSPDFFSIKRFMTYVMGRTLPSLLQPQQPPKRYETFLSQFTPKSFARPKKKPLQMI